MQNEHFFEKIRRHLPAESSNSPINNRPAIAKEIQTLLQEKNAVLIAHYYTDPEIQKLAESTGGFIGDSLEMARFGAQSHASTIVIAGVRFMGETAKILSPQKRVLMPAMQAECSLDLGCEPEAFHSFCKNNPDRTVVVYANTSAEIKSMADWVVTSSIAVDVIRHLGESGKKIIWAPDRYLGTYLQKITDADMLLWDACCVVHLEFDAKAIKKQQQLHPGARLLVHPESKPDVIDLADVVGSTSQLLAASKSENCEKFIVATESGILYKMQKESPAKSFIMAATSPATESFSCNQNCPWMKMNSLENIRKVLIEGNNEIILTNEVIKKAVVPLNRMVEFKSAQK